SLSRTTPPRASASRATRALLPAPGSPATAISTSDPCPVAATAVPRQPPPESSLVPPGRHQPIALAARSLYPEAARPGRPRRGGTGPAVRLCCAGAGTVPTGPRQTGGGRHHARGDAD